MSQSSPVFAPKQLSIGELQQFNEDGFLMLRGIFDRKLAQSIVPLVWKEMEELEDAPETWTHPVRIIKKVLQDLPIDEILTARYRAAVDDLCGAGKWETNLGVGYWVNIFPEPNSSTLRPQTTDWHIDPKADGQDPSSPDLGLSAMEYFTDIDPGGGGTAIRVGSHRQVARIAARAHFLLTADELSERAYSFIEHLPIVKITARAGDVLVMHPFTMHASTSNITRHVRIAANRPISLFEAMNLNPTGAHSYSPIEWAVVGSLDKTK